MSQESRIRELRENYAQLVVERSQGKALEYLAARYIVSINLHRSEKELQELIAEENMLRNGVK